MRVWRICKSVHAVTAFSGDGARLYAGRWHRAGVPMVYTATPRALAALELLVHMEVRLAPSDFVLIPADVPDERIISLGPTDLPENWRAVPAPSSTRELGTRWALEKGSLALRVPSVVIPEEHNVLLNPAHPDAGLVKSGSPLPFVFDPRLAPGG